LPDVVAPGEHATRYRHALPDGRVRCDVCPRGCRLRDGQRGLCFYVIEAWRLDASGCCPGCGTACAGVFDERPGAWGQRRLPVRSPR